MIAALVGSPVSHSLSPKLFSFIAEEEKCPMDYKALDVPLLNAKTFIESLKKNKHIHGLNVTIPLKEVFIEHIDELSPAVKIIGALNVLHLKDDKIFGYNTDVIGIERTLKDSDFHCENKTCLILGAGGAAKASAYVLGQSLAKTVYVYNLSDKNKALVENFKVHFPHTKWMAINEISESSNIDLKLDLLINSTPLGMTGKESGSEFFKVIDHLTFNKNALAFDLIYTPLETEFIKKCKSFNLKTVSGLGMFIYQALATWSIWKGELSNEAQLKSDLGFYLRGLLQVKQLNPTFYLTGFMGVGKTQTGLVLAHLIDAQFIDTDSFIEKKLNKSVSTVFREDGEPFFRNEEFECIKLLASESSPKSRVISLGGGALMKEENCQRILSSGHLVYLEADVPTLNERIAKHEKETNTIRPILKDYNESERIKKMQELLACRKTSYEKAEIKINTDFLSAKKVAFKILMNFGEHYSSGELKS